MKMTKRIFIGVIAIAVLVSAFALSAFAAVDATNYDDVLEYYTQPTMAAWDFEDLTVGSLDKDAFASNYKTTFSSTTQYKLYGEGDSTNKYLRIEKAQTKSANGFFICSSETSTPAVYVAFDILGGTTADNLPLVRINVGDTIITNGFSGNTVVTLDFKSGDVKYMDKTDASVTEPNKTLSGIKLAADTWYTVVLKVEGAKGLELTVTEKANTSNTATATGAAPFTTYNVVNIGAALADARNKVFFNLDNVAVFGGTYYRDAVNKQAAIEAGVVDLLGYYNTLATAEEKLAVIDVYTKLVGYGFAATGADATAAMNAFAKNAILIYSDATKVGVDAIDTSLTYAQRLAHVNAYAKYADNIPADLSALSADEKASVEAIVAAYNAEVEALAFNKDQSEKYYAAVNALDVASTDYNVIVAQFEALGALKPDATYVTEDGVALEDVVATGAAYIATAGKMITSSEAFVAAVANIATGADFVSKYENFKIAEANYFDNETFPGITAAVADFNAIKAEFLAIEAASLGYINNVNNADYAIYLSAKREYLVVADEFFNSEDFEPTFPGVAEANELKATLTQLIADKEAAAQAYIAAVNALDGLTGDALVAAINTAKGLQATGNIQGVEGIVEANIKLDNAISAIEIVSGRAAQFVTYVANIKAATTLEARFEAIAIARAIADSVTEGDGVAAAKTELAAAVTQYNADVKALNGGFAEVNAVASGMLVAPTTAAGVATKVVAFIKSFFA